MLTQYKLDVEPKDPTLKKFDSLLSKLIDKSCIECKRKIHTHKKTTIFILDFGPPNQHALIWSKLEEKQEMQLEIVLMRRTLSNFCLSLI